MAGKDKRYPCRFAAARLKPRVRAFAAEIGGVMNGKDTESVHRMRVASRRLRSALPIFSFCFPPEKYRRWMKYLKRTARALGNARDTDVQILFLDRYETALPRNAPEREGTGRIRAILTGMREAEQEKIHVAISALGKKGVLEEISSAVDRAGRGRQKGEPGTGSETILAPLYSSAIRVALSRLLSFGPAVRDPGNITGHHELRIATKKLRYTLEMFRPLYPDRLRPPVENLKRLQDLLGRIHDCDVWVRFLSGLQSCPAEDAAARGGRDTILPLAENEEAGIAALLRDRRSARDELYTRLVKEWDSTIVTSLKDRLLAATGETGGDPGPSADGTEASAGPAVALTGLYPAGAGHARQVTRLALILFDELHTLHRLGENERRILEIAGRFHDIGWAFGKKRHHVRSGRLILADRTLPITSRERLIIALIARYHRKQVPERPDRLFRRLSARDRKRVLKLASLLRIADGLDYTHKSRVRSLACTVAKDEIACSLTVDGDGSIERGRALARADLFERVYQRRFAIV